MKVLKFYADWCGPCKAATPAFNKLLAEYVALDSEEVNIEERADFARQHNVRGIPTFVLLNVNGDEIGRTNNTTALRKLIEEQYV